jgi:hypothetical protein
MTVDDINALTEADFDKLYLDGREIYSLKNLKIVS